VILPIIIAVIFIALCSLLREPARQRFSVTFVAIAGTAYLSGGLSARELAFCAAMTVLAYRGRADYRVTDVGWLLHCGGISRTIHTATRSPPFAPNSFLGCFMCAHHEESASCCETP
jgi:Family of unknown function (DUF6010)